MLRTILLLIASLCGFVYLTYSLEVFEISFTDLQSLPSLDLIAK